MREYTSGTLGYVSYEALRAGTHSFQDLAVYNINEVTMGRGAEAQELRASYVTASFFPLLRVQSVLGRFFDAQEDATTDAQHVAVISYGLWRRAFGQSPQALGRTIVIGDEPFTVIGVAPSGFTGTELGRVDLWLPMSLLGPRITNDWTRAWDAQWLGVIGHLKPGITGEQAGADATTAHRRAYGDNPSRSFTPQARLTAAPLGANEQGDEPGETTVSRWLVGVTLAVLLIACANVTNLLLARAVRRRREVVVRIALGVGRLRLVRLLLAESLLLAIAGSLAGLAVAYVTGSLVRSEQRSQEIGVRVALGARAGNIVRLVLRESLRMTLLGISIGAVVALIGGRFLQALLFDASAWDPALLAAVVGSLITVAIAAGLLPAWRANRVDPMEALRAE